MNQYKVSVIIPTYNYSSFIAAAVDSVLAQTFPAVEVIIVDDGSTDNTKDILSRYGDRIKYVFQENKGVSAARNAGVKNSTGNLIAFLDADDIWLPEKLEKQVECFRIDEGVGFVHCAIQEFDARGNILEEETEGAEGWVAEKVLLLGPAIAGPGSTSLIKREIFDEAGGFDERQEMRAAEDWEFCYRVALQCKVKFVPEILARYRNHGANRHLNLRNFEQAVLTAFDQIFSKGDERTLRLRRKAYGNLYTILAGSHFQSKNYPAFVKNTVKGLWYAPGNINRYLSYPVRLSRNGFSRYNWVQK